MRRLLEAAEGLSDAGMLAGHWRVPLRMNLDWSRKQWQSMAISNRLKRFQTTATAAITPSGGTGHCGNPDTYNPQIAISSRGVYFSNIYRGKTSSRTVEAGRNPINILFYTSHNLFFLWRARQICTMI